MRTCVRRGLLYLRVGNPEEKFVRNRDVGEQEKEEG